jgi:hypothetical protein
MSTTVYTVTEARETIPKPWQLFRGAYIQSIALDYVMSTCIPNLLRADGLVTSIADPYTIKFDYDMVNTLLQSYRDSHMDLDLLCSTNRNELERGKKQLRHFIYKNSLASRYFSINGYIAPVELTIKGSLRTYKVTMYGPSQTGSEKRGMMDPYCIEIIIEDDGSPDHNPSSAQLYQRYEDKDSIKDDLPFIQLYVNKGMLPRVEEALQGAEILIREVYLSDLEKYDGVFSQAYLSYATARVLQEVLAYSQLVTGVFHGLSLLNNDKFYAKMEEVLGVGGEDEIRQFFKEVILPSIGNLADAEAVISATLPDTPFYALGDSVGVRENIRNYPPNHEMVIKNAGLAVVQRKFLELSGQDAPQGIQNLGRLLGHYMINLIKSESNVVGLIDEWDTSLNTMIEQVPFPHPTADSERFAPEAIKIVTRNWEREGLLKLGSGTVAIRSLRENQTHAQYLKTVRSLKYSKKEELMKMQGESLDYSKVFWDERDTPYQARFMEIILDKDSYWDEIYEVCLRLEGRQRGPDETAGAVYTKRLHDEGTTSLLPIVAEMSQFNKQLIAEMRSAQKPGWMEETIQREVGGRI